MPHNSPRARTRGGGAAAPATLWGLIALLVVAVLLTPTAARADAAAQARFHDEQARIHYQKGRFEEAIREFYQSLQLAPNPRITFNIALCFEQLDRPADAFMLFSEYVASSEPSEQRQAYAKQAITGLLPSIARLEVESEPPGATIYVDRRELGDYGRTPRVIAVEPGSHRVWVELAGHRQAASEVQAVQGDLAQVSLAPERILGRLEVRAPVSARAEIRTPEGKVVAQGATPLDAALPPGPYEVQVFADDHEPWRGLSAVRADETAAVAAAPEPLPPPTGEMTITSNVSGAVIELDGQPAAFAPTVLGTLPIGRHDLAVRSPGLLPWRGPVEIGADHRTWVTVSLEKPAETTRSPFTWVMGGLGAAALVGAGITGGLALATHDDFEAAVNQTDRAELRDRGQALNTTADVLLVTGIASLAAGAILYFATETTSGRPSSASITSGGE